MAIDPRTGAGVGVARYIRDRNDPTRAELAVAVVDDWQRRGVGTRLAPPLATRARQEGIATFTAEVLADNRLMLNLTEELGDIRTVNRGLGTVGLEVELPNPEPGRLARRRRRADLRAASGHRHAG